MKKLLKKNIKLIIGFVIGILIVGCIGVYATTVISSSDVEYLNENSGLSADTIQKAIDEIYVKAKSTEFKIGDYVKMTPTKTSFAIPKTLTDYSNQPIINPSELNLWRVIKVNEDKTVDVVSEYVSSVGVIFSSSTGYQNLVGMLNYIAKQYENQKYTVASRCMGYDGTQTEYITDTSILTSTTLPQSETTSNSNVTSETESKGLGDVGYEMDYNLVKSALKTTVANKVGTTTAVYYWLASRKYLYTSDTSWGFYGNNIGINGNIIAGYLYTFGDDNNGVFNIHGNGAYIRPIVTLKSEIKATSGDGSSDSPYVLS